MSESIGEMILPGTYIDVRAEGLIGVSGIATGNVGIVGTANRGPLNQVVVLGSYSEALDTFGSYDRWPDKVLDQPKALSLTRTLEQLFTGGASSVYAVRVANVAGQLASTTWSVTAVVAAVDTEVFKLSAKTPGTWANAVVATLTTSLGQPATLTLVLGRRKEEFTGATAAELASAVNDGSALVDASLPAEAVAGLKPDKIQNPTTVPSDGEPATDTQYKAGLDLLADQPVNIVVVAGTDAKSSAGVVIGHLEGTENDGKERIAVLGVSSNEVAKIISDDASKVGSGRVVLVAPGISASDAARAGERNTSVVLPASYAAAVVAGRLSALAPHVSLTNKDVAVDSLSVDYTRAQQKLLLLNRTLVLQKNLGIRVLKGNSTDVGPFRQISVRRIVDYAKAGVRIGSNPYIGRLNNARVRAALKATLDGFLSGMVVDEMLTAYTLEVLATRQEEINGIARVVMTLKPTFSIDFVKVIMNLE